MSVGGCYSGSSVDQRVDVTVDLRVDLRVDLTVTSLASVWCAAETRRRRRLANILSSNNPSSF